MKQVFGLLRRNGVALAGIAAIILLVTLVSFSSRGVSIVLRSYDVLRTTKSRSEAVIIAIDDKSLQAIGAWPWDRSIFAKLVETLNDTHARSVNFDVLFLESRSGDESFKDALLKSTIPIVLASKVDNGSYHSSFLDTGGDVTSAIVNVDPDEDGKVRSYTMPYTGTSTCILPLSEAAFQIATHKKDSRCDTPRELFRYPDTIATYSLIDVIEGKVDRGEFEGKTIFIGATSLDLLDTFVGMGGEKIPGVTIHASQFVSKLNNVHDRMLSGFGSIILLVIVGLLSAFMFLRYRNVAVHVVSSIAFTIIILIGSVIAFEKGVMIPFVFAILLVYLILGFITLLNIVKEQKKNAYIESLFSKYVHKDVLKELMNSSHLDFKGEKREMTVLFSDLRGFTTLSETLQPEELTRILNAYFSAMTPCILDERGTIDKFIGDAIMAFWNAPLLIEDHEEHAVKSAQKMIEALAHFNKKHHTSLAAGIGIHSGVCIVGNVGSSDRINYTVLGDTVNLSSRIESLTKRYGASILISESVKDKLKTGFAMRLIDRVIVKGKNTPTTLYEVIVNEKLDKDDIVSYETAFRHYEKGDFEKAIPLLEKLQEKGDTASALLLSRIGYIKNEKLSWNGIWEYEDK